LETEDLRENEVPNLRGIGRKRLCAFPAFAMGKDTYRLRCAGSGEERGKVQEGGSPSCTFPFDGLRRNRR
jgi:hypothetical protein